MTNPFISSSGNLSIALEIPVYRQILPQIGAELRRARRYERALSLILLSPAALLAESTQKQREILPRSVPLLYVLLGSVLRNSVRETDLLGSLPERLLYALFLPEAREEEARLAVRRLSDAFQAVAGCQLRSGIAQFPRDGLTLDALFEHARKEWSGNEFHRVIGSIQPEVSHG